MVSKLTIEAVSIVKETGYRLVNTKYPTIHLFDDVADADEYDALYELMALSNPRLLNEGNLNLLPSSEIPFGIAGVNYAVAPFTHVNADGTRFSNGAYGVLYIADTIKTAIAEVKYHQNLYWAGIHGLDYERFVFRALRCEFGPVDLADLTTLPVNDPVYDAKDYFESQRVGRVLREQGALGLKYHSVRAAGGTCVGLFTPQDVKSIVQSGLYQMVWDGEAIKECSKVVSA